MAIKGVDTKCYILALFVRDDGERFLLGSGHYEFKDTQMHFAANAIQTDIVEVQGNDGFLLAGQVRRPGTQSFDGYVGDGTMSKEETESYRRQFFSFFRKNFFYKVIYVFSDGTAIQRKSGFLVDDPTVEELYQMYPEYHVALNFEDVNYYSYSEDEEGQEQYAKEATIDTSSMRATGGLVWDNLGVVWEATQWGGEQTASGTEITIQNDMSVMSPTKDTRLYGDTFQNGTPTPDAPVVVQTVTGEQTVTIGDGVSSQSYEINLGKNLLKLANYTAGGVTTTLNSDGKITVSGTTANNYANFMAYQTPLLSPSGTYTFSRTGDNTYRASLTLFSRDKSQNTSINIAAGSNSTTATIPFEIGYVAGAYTNLTVGSELNFTTGLQLEFGSTPTSFAPYFTPIELCKLGDYQDYIYKGADGWYLHKEVERVVLNGTETWGQVNSYAYFTTQISTDIIRPSNIYSKPLILSDYYSPASRSNLYDSVVDYGIGAHENTPSRILIRNKDYTSIPAFTTWLSNHNTTVYYALATPTDTQIMNETLVGQLNALGAMKLFIGENNLVIQATGTNLPASLSLKYYTTVSMTGAVWEEGGSGGATVVEVDSITNTYPIWRIKGPAVNPQLSVINTNTTIRYTGTVTSTQTLEIDMFNKTAKLNGVSVIGNVSGDWVSLAPGTNRVIYTAENADAQPSTIEWQEVVG